MKFLPPTYESSIVAPPRVSTATQTEPTSHRSVAVQTNANEGPRADARESGGGIINPRSDHPIGPFDDPNKPRFPPLDVPITCAATRPRPHGRNTIQGNPAQPPRYNIRHGFPKLFPPIERQAERRYRLPHPSSFKEPLEVFEVYYIVISGQAVGVFTDSDMVDELTRCITHSECITANSWMTAIELYRAAFESDMLTVTPLPGGFWDTPFPWHIVQDDSDDEQERPLSRLSMNSEVARALAPDNYDVDAGVWKSPPGLGDVMGDLRESSDRSVENDVGEFLGSDFPVEDDEVWIYCDGCWMKCE